MAAYLLDSDALIDWLNEVAESIALFQELTGRGDTLYVCSVVIAEVYAGLNFDRVARADEIVESCGYLPTDANAARQAGAWRFQFARRGTALATTDVLVAATAHAHRATLVTANLRHYPMPEVSLLPLPR